MLNIFNPRTYRSGFRALFSNWQWRRDKSFLRDLTAAMYGSNSPTIYIDCEDSQLAYEDCPHLRAVVDKKAEMFSNGEWKCVSIDDETVEFKDDPGLVLLNKPNPLQSREDFLFQYSFYKSLFNNNFMFQLRGSALVLPKVLWHLPSDEMEIKFKDVKTFFEQTKLSDIISKFIQNIGTYEKEYEVKDVIYKAENFSFKHGKGLSRISTLKLPINNLMASLKTRNVLTVNFGVKGFISSEGKDVAGPVAIRDDQRDMIEKTFEDDANLYSDKPKIKIVTVPTKFNQMSANLADMKLIETEEKDFMTICATLGMRKDIFPFVNGATFENQLNAEKFTYESTIKQDGDALAGVMTDTLKPKPGRKYILDYDWLKIMQGDQEKEATTEKIKTERLAILYDKGLISPEAWAEMEGVAMTGDGIPKTQPRQINIP